MNIEQKERPLEDNETIASMEFVLAELPSGITLTLDPLRHYPDWHPVELVGALGFIPQWIDNALQYPTLKAALIAQYEYYHGPLKGSTIADDGRYQSPYDEDPDLYPLVSTTVRGETFYQYHYGIVAVVNDNGEQWISRFD